MTFSISPSQPQHRPTTTSRWLSRTLIAATVLATGAQAVCVSMANSTACPLFGTGWVDTAILSGLATNYNLVMSTFANIAEFDAAVNNATGFESSPSCTGYNSTVRIPYQNTVLCAILANEDKSKACKGASSNPPVMCTPSCVLYQKGLSNMVSTHCPMDSTSQGLLKDLNTVCTANDPNNWANLHDTSSTCIDALKNEPSYCGLGSLKAKCDYCKINSTDTTCCADFATACPSTTTTISTGPSSTSTLVVPPTSTETKPASSGKTGLSNGALGGIIGGSVGVVLIALVMFMCVRRARKSNGSSGGKSSNLSRQMSNSSARYNISSPKIQEEGFVAAAAASIPMTPIANENAKFGAGAAAIAGAGAVAAAEGGGKQSYCQALYPYQASMADELDLTPGDIINVQRVFDDGWAVGVNMNTSNEGAFPVVCVMFVDESALDDDFEDVNMHSMTPMTLREEDDGRRSPSGRNSPRSSLPSRSSSPVHLPRRNSSIRDSTVIVPGSSPLTSSPLAGGNAPGGRMTPPVRDTMLSDASSINRWWDGEK
ncbi:hypothetical protein BGZ83_011314 [Gryganskiella cystojenkinii]|nr:hypothetical protein BGZ83_011314 [Gryganskiella cystojenkinii]